MLAVHGRRARCADRECLGCPTWRRLRRIRRAELRRPPRLSVDIETFAPAFWVIPARSFIYTMGRPSKEITRISDAFYAFPHGAASRAYPLALGMRKALKTYRSSEVEVGAIVPIPLSPDKARKREIHRSRLLAKELGLLLDAPVREWLKLTTPASKSLSHRIGLSDAQHRARYRRLLSSSLGPRRVQHVLLVDDVSTYGGTLSAAADALKSINGDIRVYATTAGQMIIRSAVADHRGLIV